MVKLSRRTVLKFGLAAGAGLALPLGALAIPLAQESAAQPVASPSDEVPSREFHTTHDDKERQP